MPKNFVSYDNAEDLMEGINSKKVSKSDLTSIFATGSTNTTGSVITSGTYFYLNGVLVKAISDIAVGDTFTEDTNYETITDGALNEASGGSGGHTIEDAAGNVLQQQDTMQFMGGLKATNDPQNGKTLIDDTPTLVTWEAWNAMTPEQRAAIPKAQITNVPGANGTISAEILKELWVNPSPASSFASQNITLASDDYDFLLALYYVSTSDVRICSVIAPKGESLLLGAPATGAGGSISLNRTCAYSSATVFSMGNATRATGTTAGSSDNTLCIPVAIYGFKKTLSLDFSAIASDVSTLASKCMLSDGETSVADVLDKGSVSVTADGVKTYSTLLNELFALVNYDKVTGRSYIALGGTIFQITYRDSTLYQFSRPEVDSTSNRIQQMIVQATNSKYRQVVGTTFTDNSSVVVPNETKIEFIY